MGPLWKLLIAAAVLVTLASMVEGQDIHVPDVHIKPHTALEGYAHDQEKEFIEFCEKQQEIKDDPDSFKRECKRIHEKDFTDDDLRMLFSIFVMILWGAIVRTLLRWSHISIPYTVVLLISGIIIGIIARYECNSMYTFTAIARIKPELILFTFLPVLIFETAFDISAHVFLKACWQIIILAVPGMIMATVLTALLCFEFFTAYNWSFLQAMFFGSIVSATDPVAVVAILKELGVAESLSVLIDGESLFNDGVAILLYEIFKDLLEEDGGEQSTGGLIAHIILKFIQIAIGGPIFGFIMAKIAIFCLQRIFNDGIVEITITLASAYLTYYLAEDVLGVSGVCAVVLLGLTLSAEKTCISPEILEEVEEFWAMLAHLANTVLFFLTGIIIGERGSRDLELVDLYYLILLYLALNFIRFIMLATLAPFLSRIGYGVTWQNLVVMVWGGLRGAVGICLSLQVYEDTFFCEDVKLGPKVLFQTAGIVLLTLAVNGTTTKKLLDILQLTAISAGRVEEMQIAVKHLMDAQKRGSAMLKHDRFLADANWDYIKEFTYMSNPYKDMQIKYKKAKVVSSIISIHEDSHEHECPGCHALVENEPTSDEYRVITEDARLRVIKALKISYWAQFEQGILTDPAVKTLAAMADNYEDMELVMLKTKDLKKYWEVSGCFPWLRTALIKQFGPRGRTADKMPPKPTQCWRVPFWYVITNPWFDNCMAIIVLANIIPAIWELAVDAQAAQTEHGMGQCEHENTDRVASKKAFAIVNWVFTVIYVLEFLFKILGGGCMHYWTNRWNYIDFFIIPIGILDVILSCFPCKGHGGLEKILKGLRMFRIIRVVRLIRPFVPFLLNVLNTKINKLLFFGYDIAVGHLWAIDDVLKYLGQMIENQHVAGKIKESLERDRLECVKEIGLIQRDHPGITIAVKTRHASRAVLNQMKNTLHDLRMDGLLDEKENDLLLEELEHQMKKLWSSPSYIPPESPEVLLENLVWVYGDEELKDFIFTNATVVNFAMGEVIASAGDAPSGIHVIISGMVQITYTPTDAIVAERRKYGAIPNMEIFRDFDFDKPAEDLLTAGTVIGESGVLTKRARAATVKCETDVSAYFIPMAIMDEAMKTFNMQNESLEVRLWRSCGIRRGIAYLPTTSFYQSWNADKIHMHVERSCVPIGSQFTIIDIPEYVLDVFVIEGMVEDLATGDVFIAPSLVSRACTRIVTRDNPKTLNRVLLITQDNIGHYTDNLAQCVHASIAFRRGTQSKNEDETQEKRFTLHLNFSARQKKRRRSSYTVDDEKKEKDASIRRRNNLKDDGRGKPPKGKEPPKADGAAPPAPVSSASKTGTPKSK